MRATHTGPSLYVARPIQIKNPACLACHSEPKAAPASMLKAYGEQAGFDWQLNEIIGAQVVSVPMAVPMQRAKTTFYTSIGALVAISFAMFVDAARKCRTTVQFYLRLVAQVDDLDLKVQLSKHAAAEAAARSAPKS